MRLLTALLISLFSLASFAQDGWGWGHFVSQATVSIPTDSLKAYYTFNGNANDESGNNYDGIVTGAILDTNRNGKINSSYYFDGSTSTKITLDAGLKLYAGEWSIAFWIKTQDVTNLVSYVIGWSGVAAGIICPGGTSVTLGDDFQLFDFTNSPNNLVFFSGSNVDQYYFVVFRYNSGTFTIYVDDDLKTTKNNTYSVLQSQLILGTRGDGAFPFIGNLDAIYFYSKELTEQEMTVIYNYNE